LDRLKTDILTLLSHETRTPLTTIFGPLELLMSDVNLSPQQKQMLQMVEDGARRIHELTEQAIRLSSLQAGLIHFELRRHDMGLLVRESITEILPIAASAGVELTLASAGLIEVNCDAEQIHTSVAALLSNAVSHSPKPGAIEISLTAQESCVVLAVMDRGPGIPEHFLPRIFDCFSVPDISKHRSGPGLSLATARAVVRGHGGMLTAENRPGGGAVFELRLPSVECSRSTKVLEGDPR
jgi:signal transduction histidine kinase